jgi:hypothetical protein
MSNRLIVILVVIIVVAIVTSIVCSYFASDKAKKNDPSADKWSKASMISAGIAGLVVLVLAFYVLTPSSEKEDINVLVDKTTRALQKHTGEANNHIGIINGALSKMTDVSKNLNQACDQAPNFTCATKNEGIRGFNHPRPEAPRFQFPRVEAPRVEVPKVTTPKIASPTSAQVAEDAEWDKMMRREMRRERRRERD